VPRNHPRGTPLSFQERVAAPAHLRGLLEPERERWPRDREGRRRNSSPARQVRAV